MRQDCCARADGKVKNREQSVFLGQGLGDTLVKESIAHGLAEEDVKFGSQTLGCGWRQKYAPAGDGSTLWWRWPTPSMLFEFKLDGDEAEALAQIVETEYYRRYSGKGKPLVLVGVNFSTESRSVAGWHVG